jgi:hypothetical protein
MDEWHATEEFVLLTGNLASVLKRFDPLGVGGDAAPSDEYDVEAGQVARILLAEHPTAAEGVAPIVDQVFDHYGFSSPDADSRRALVDEVWAEYEALQSGR